MQILTVQLNHPAVEKEFSNEGYCNVGQQIIREWNDNPNQHYRKFIRNRGIYIENIIDSNPKDNDLIFWGEWEGYSKFHPLKRTNPNGIHEPFHSIIGRACQNTDPYVFGDFFKYAICFQTGVMRNLDPGSLILFGTTTKVGFLLDTVFIVKSKENAENVFLNSAANYTQVYREETIEQLGETYLGPNYSRINSIYQSYTWWDNQKKEDKEIDCFSYVPCRIDDMNYDKVIIPIPPMAKQRVGHPYKHLNPLNKEWTSPKKVWDYITNEVIKQGFYLGIRMEEPKINNGLACGKSSKKNCNCVK
ncbi:MAG: hypothetical protein KDE33_11220 [Bacteroidetes bacterium]|nr:hypothetical protein [Bacteroidota bacterium]